MRLKNTHTQHYCDSSALFSEIVAKSTLMKLMDSTRLEFFVYKTKSVVEKNRPL